MTLEEAIEERLKVVKVQEKLYEEASTNESKEIIKSATDNDRQLAEWLKELKELREENEKLMSHVCDLQLAYNNELIDKRKAKRLLRGAVRTLNDGSCNKDCRQCENHKSCDYDNRFKWKYTNEVLKLIEEEEK